MIYELPPIEPVEQSNSYDYTITLGDHSYRLILTWRERPAAWYLDLYNSADVLLIAGKRLSVDWPLLFRHTGRLPAGGQLILLDTADSMLDCTFEELGDRCRWCWIPEAEIPDPVASGYPITVTAVP